MERNAEDSRQKEAQILARLRRRPASASQPDDDPLFAVETSPNVAERAQNPAFSDAESASEPTAESRAEALRRLVATAAPKEPMSALSPTLRNLREELTGENADFSPVFDGDTATSTDATLDLIESELAAGSEITEIPETSKTSETPQTLAVESNAAPLPEREAEPQTPAPEPSPSQQARRETPETPLQSLNFRKISGAAPRVDVVSSAEREKTEKRVAISDLMVVSNLKKGYVKAKKLIPVLQGVDLTARQGELLAIVGQSGSGKSTLLHLMGTLDVPDSGTIHFDGQRIDNLPTDQRDVLRNRFIGMIFQFYHLIPEMTTLENVLAPLMIRDSIFAYWRKKSQYVEKAKEILNLVGLSHRLRHRPNELSGGEMQRASIARALISEPRILLADEPTGNLDSKASVGVLQLLRKLNEEQKLTVVMVTHDPSQAAEADRAIRLVDGQVVPE